LITEQDLKEAIAECEGTRSPNSNTCTKLAAFYTIYDHLYGNNKSEIQPINENYSYSAGPVIEFTGNSEFFDLVKDKGINNTFPIIEELMTTLQVINPRLYDSVMRKLSEL
jgi:hypothetical protein